MKIVKLVFAALLGGYAVAQGALLVSLLRGRHSPVEVVASAAILCLALAFSLALLKSALGRPANPS